MRLDRELSCIEVVELVTAYLDDALGAADRERVEEHLVFCDGCSTYLEQNRQTVALTGRLVGRVGAWNRAVLDELGRDVLARTRRRFGAIAGVGGYVGDVQRHLASGRVPLAAFAAARAAEVAGGPVEYERERARQAAWLADRLGLGTG